MSYGYGQPQQPGHPVQPTYPGQPSYLVRQGYLIQPGYPAESGWPAPPGAQPFGYPGYPHRRGAPGSVLAVAILQYLGGLGTMLLGVLIGVLAISVSQVRQDVTTSLPPDLAASIAGVGFGAGAFLVFAGLVAIWLGRKLRRGRQWARILFIVVSAVSAAGTLYNGLFGPGSANVLIGLVVPVLYLLLLNTPAARSYFRTGTY